MRLERTTAALVLATGVICGGVVAAATPTGQATQDTGAQTPKPKAPVATPAPDPDEPHYPPGPAQKVGTVPWTAAQLKPEHTLLKDFVGRFTTKVHVFKGPYKRLFDTEGTAEGKVLMDGAFVQLTHAESRMKYPMQVLTIYGFDTAIRKYTADTIDSTTTAIIHLVGTYDAATKKLVMTGHFMDQQSRTLTILRTVTTFVDAKSWTYEEFESHAVGGPETPVVTITFTRL